MNAGSFDPVDQNLFTKDNLAGSVAREIRRIDISPADGISEGAAYKAAWDRKGSGWQKHIEAARADFDAMENGVLWWPGFGHWCHRPLDGVPHA